MNSVEDIYEAYKSFQGSDDGFNRFLLDELYNERLCEEAFIEYLAITQSDIGDCLEEGLA